MYCLSVYTAFLSCHLKKNLGLPSLVQSLSTLGNPLEVQWSGLHAPTAGGPGSVPGWGTEIPHAVLCGQKFKKKRESINIFQKTNHRPSWSSLSICIWYSLLYSFSLPSDFLVVLPTLKWMLGSLAVICSECVLIQWRSLWQMHFTGWRDIQGRKHLVSWDPLGFSGLREPLPPLQAPCLLEQPALQRMFLFWTWTLLIASIEFLWLLAMLCVVDSLCVHLSAFTLGLMAVVGSGWVCTSLHHTCHHYSS